MSAAPSNRVERVSASPGDIGHLLRAAKRLHEALKTRGGPSPLTPPQYVVLLALTRVPGSDQRTVSEIASLDQATVSGIVGRLQHRGLVRRVPDSADARRKLLYPAGEAEELVRADSAQLRRADQLILAALAPDDAERLIQELRQIAFSRAVDPTISLAGENADGEVFTVTETSRAFGRLARICQQNHDVIWAQHMGSLLTPQQFTLLAAVGAHVGIAQSALRDSLLLDKVTVAGLTVRMQRNRLLRVDRDPLDGRQRVLSLTRLGADTLRIARGVAAQVRDELLRPIQLPGGSRLETYLARIIDEHRAEGSPH